MVGCRAFLDWRILDELSSAGSFAWSKIADPNVMKHFTAACRHYFQSSSERARLSWTSVVMGPFLNKGTLTIIHCHFRNPHTIGCNNVCQSHHPQMQSASIDCLKLTVHEILSKHRHEELVRLFPLMVALSFSSLTRAELPTRTRCLTSNMMDVWTPTVRESSRQTSIHLVLRLWCKCGVLDKQTIASAETDEKGGIATWQECITKEHLGNHMQQEGYAKHQRIHNNA